LSNEAEELNFHNNMVFLSDKSQCVHIWFSVRYVRIFNGIQDQNSFLWKCGLYIYNIYKSCYNFSYRVMVYFTRLFRLMLFIEGYIIYFYITVYTIFIFKPV